jgi:hemin uptake protein HemP
LGDDRPIGTRADRGEEADETSARHEEIESGTLFRGAREVVIRHNRDRYVLRITRQGKLILNK